MIIPRLNLWMGSVTPPTSKRMTVRVQFHRLAPGVNGVQKPVRNNEFNRFRFLRVRLTRKRHRGRLEIYYMLSCITTIVDIDFRP